MNFLPPILKFCKFSSVFFADDAQLYIQCPPHLIAFAIAHMNEEAQIVANWATSHGLSLNVSKTKAMILGSDHNLKYLSNHNISPILINGAQIDFVNQVKNLGVILSCDLRWNAHISSVSSKVHSALYKLRTRGWLLDRDTKIMLVNALVILYIDYACLVYNDIPDYLNLKVKRLFNASIRFIYNLKKDESVSQYYNQLEWLSARRRRDYFLGCSMFSILTTERPQHHYEKIINNVYIFLSHYYIHITVKFSFLFQSQYLSIIHQAINVYSI